MSAILSEKPPKGAKLTRFLHETAFVLVWEHLERFVMITKEFTTRDGDEIVRVTFTVPADKWSTIVHWVGDFNDGDRLSLPFQQNRDGSWSLTLEMEPDHIYQFRYLCDSREWLNDSAADGFIPNGHLSENCLLITKRDFHSHIIEEN